MNHTSLEIFSVVAEEMSIIKAAKRLGRVQSNITTRIQQLEQELDAQLFIRENKKLRVSAQGKQFLVYTKKMLSLAEEARQSLHPQHPRGELSFGSMECAAASRLAVPLFAFNQMCPDVNVKLTTGPTRQLTEMVQQSELDCALVALPVSHGKPANCPDDLCCQPLFVENLLMVLPVGMHQITDLREFRSGKLAAFRQGCTYRDIAAATIKNMGGHGQGIQIQEVGSYHTMLACVAAGGYICLLPESVLNLLQLPEGLEVLSVTRAITQLIWRKDFESPALDNLRRILLDTSNVEPGQTGR